VKYSATSLDQPVTPVPNNQCANPLECFCYPQQQQQTKEWSRVQIQLQCLGCSTTDTQSPRHCPRMQSPLSVILNGTGKFSIDLIPSGHANTTTMSNNNRRSRVLHLANKHSPLLTLMKH